MKVIVFTDPESGIVGVVTPDPKSRRRPGDEDEATWLQRIAARDVPAGAVNVQIVDAQAVPKSRRFREAWRLRPGGKIEVDLARAKELIEEEVPLRKGAGAQKLNRVRAAVRDAKTPEELEAALHGLGWKTAVRPGRQAQGTPDESEDF